MPCLASIVSCLCDHVSIATVYRFALVDKSCHILVYKSKDIQKAMCLRMGTNKSNVHSVINVQLRRCVECGVYRNLSKENLHSCSRLCLHCARDPSNYRYLRTRNEVAEFVLQSIRRSQYRHRPHQTIDRTPSRSAILKRISTFSPVRKTQLGTYLFSHSDSVQLANMQW
jgi:hypothetical protein